MICKNCKKESVGGLKYCSFCGAQLTEDTAADDKTHTEYGEENGYRSGGTAVNPNIYKLLCICMGFCLIAGSVVWAVIMLRDRIDSPKRADNTAAAQISADTENTAAEHAVSKADTTTTTTTTTTVTTTTNPYKQTIEPELTDDYGTMYVLSDELIIRIGPGYDYDRLDETIPNGEALEISAEQVDAKSGESWCYINYNDSTGWVCKSLLSQTDPTVAVVQPDDYYYDSDRDEVVVTRYGGLKLYSGPGVTYEVIDTIPEGESVTREGYNYFSVKWIYVSYGEQYGWVQSYDGDWFNPTFE